MGVISQYFLKNEKLNETFEVIRCDESCSPMDVWRGDQSNFAVWTRENMPIQNEFFHVVHEKIKQADVFIFQSTETSGILELSTKYLCDNISKGTNICIPNIRLFLYCNDITTLVPYIKYAQTKISNANDPSEIANFLRTSSDPELTNILEKEYPISTVYERYRNENAQRAKEDSERYTNYICLEEFIKENYKKKILAVSHNHANKPFYIGVLAKLLKFLNVDNIEIEQNEIQFPGPSSFTINPLQFNFFKNYFPDLKETDMNKCDYSLEYVIENHYFVKYN